MKLISKFHDYYDTLLSQGHDEQVVFVRERRMASAQLPASLLPWEQLHRAEKVGAATLKVVDKANQGRLGIPSWRLDDEHPCQRLYAEAFVVVEGKAYPAWIRKGRGLDLAENLVLDPDYPIGAPTEKPLVQAMTSAMQAERARLGGAGKEPEVEADYRLYERWRVSARDKEAASRIYADARARFLEHDFTELHLALGAPVLLLGPDVAMVSLSSANHSQWRLGPPKPPGTVAVVCNPRLADLGWARALDPASCFQSISQFISGVVPGRQMPMVEISDASKVAKHGFDPTYGFRRRPQS